MAKVGKIGDGGGGRQAEAVASAGSGRGYRTTIEARAQLRSRSKRVTAACVGEQRRAACHVIVTSWPCCRLPCLLCLRQAGNASGDAMIFDAIAIIVLSGMMLVPLVNLVVGLIVGACLGGPAGVSVGLALAVLISVVEKRIGDQLGWGSS
jgi:hypothetical protein